MCKSNIDSAAGGKGFGMEGEGWTAGNGEKGEGKTVREGESREAHSRVNSSRLGPLSAHRLYL